MKIQNIYVKTRYYNAIVMQQASILDAVYT